ncbi:Crp/Fnr family transcriptional regulator [Actinomadura sp. KC216]|uniref:Crp/Fnr family transcriptional regulator n=1 Tax=Actinomadura sp. KC216 TaxID=2530370 RepID=UPI00140490F0|nr:Crp/Fnr family transcriptional regulator [Actinomadura sp. KC216]
MAWAQFERGDPLLTGEETLWLEANGQTLRRSAGHVFFEEGEEADFVLLIREGHVLVSVGRPKRVLAVRGPNELVGEMAPLRGGLRSGSVEAIGDVEVLLISAARWIEFLQAHPRAALAQIAAMDARLEHATRKIVESELAVERRLALALMELLDSGLGQDGDQGIVLRISQQGLAEFAGASLDSVKKTVRTFKSASIVGTARQKMIILDRDALREIAAGERTASAQRESSQDEPS